MGEVVTTGDSDKKISKQIGWMNNNLELADKISYNDVAEALAIIDLTSAMKILKDLEMKAHEVEKPTAYILSAARRRAPDAYGDSSKRPRNADRGPGLRLPANLDEDTESKTISRQVGQINAQCGLAQRI